MYVTLPLKFSEIIANTSPMPMHTLCELQTHTHTYRLYYKHTHTLTFDGYLATHTQDTMYIPPVLYQC